MDRADKARPRGKTGLRDKEQRPPARQENKRLTAQTRKQLGKHYANRYRSR